MAIGKNLIAYFSETQPHMDPRVLANAYTEAFDAFMEGAYIMLRILGGEINYTYTTKAGHKVQMILRAPE